MTRGSIFLITDRDAYGTIEFNGDMDMYERGGEVLKLLKNASIANFKKKANRFNKRFFNYDEQITEKRKSIYDFFSSDYYSEYSYIKNISKKPEPIIVGSKGELIYVLKQGEALVLNYGKVFKVIEKEL